jgi:uncharacterized membrane protein YqgA involved in biofilm formation
MPIGVIVNVTAVVLGGLVGSLMGNKLSQQLKDQMNAIMGLCALCMGIRAVVLMKNMPAVVFAVILGTLVGLVLKLGEAVRKGSALILNKVIAHQNPETDELMLTAVVLFCISGTGIYGALDSGMTGNHSILITKAVLDFFTAMIFACKLGKATAWIGIPQAVVMLSLFALAKVILPLTTPDMIADFKACGGFLLVATGLRIMQVKAFPVADMIPAMLFVMPVSHIWSTWLLPLLQG